MAGPARRRGRRPCACGWVDLRPLDSRAIEAHGLIGDLETASLVALDGTIDFLCWPSFDSPSIFAGLLDPERGGSFELHPVCDGDGARHRQLYLPDTNLLLTRCLFQGGVGEVSDFMSIEPGSPGQALVRRIKAVRGELRCHMACRPRFDYARVDHRAREAEGGIRFEPDSASFAPLRLMASVPMSIEGSDATAQFRLCEGESAWFVLEEALPEQSRFAHDHSVQVAFKQTMDFWHGWIAQCTYEGRWRETVRRSALALKLLQSRRHGAFVAAPTFGLPEDPGGERNWDYRYVWIRDASFTLYALLRLGFGGEARSFMQWLERHAREAGEGHLSVFYRLDGRTGPAEEVLEHLSGYRDSRPVRIGNAARAQLQLDIYGELMDSIYLSNKYVEPISHIEWERCVAMVDWVCANWQRADDGVWESRGGRKHYLFSRVLCWVAIDRGLRLAGKRSLPAPVEHWRATRDAVYRDVHENFWNPELGAFVQALGEETLDASSLILPLVRFISPRDPRWLSHLTRIEERLVQDSLVLRYRTDSGSDGIAGGEGTFSICSFWYAEAVARSGDLQKARHLFEKALGYANHLGLYSEELGATGEQLGNFPQAFTHLALISAAYDLDRRLDAARGGRSFAS